MPTRPDADCFGAPGRLRAPSSRYDKPNALSLLATAGRTTKSVAPARAHRPVRLRARRSAAIGGVAGRAGHELLVLEVQPRGGHGRRRPARDPRRRRGPVLPRAGQLPEPEPGRARAPGPGAARRPGSRSRSRVIEHKCVDRPGHVRDHLQQRPGGRGHRHRRPTRRRPPAPTAPPSSRSARAARLSSAPPAAPTSRPRSLATCVGAELDAARRRAASRSSAARRATRSRAPRATTRSARAAATTGSTLAQGRRRRDQLRPRARTWCGSKRKLANDGLVIKGSCERVKRSGRGARSSRAP